MFQVILAVQFIGNTIYTLHGDTQFDLPLVAFLEAYYQAVKSGTIDQLAPPAKKNSKQQEGEDFSFLKTAYPDRKALVDHCRGMLHRYSRERVTAYWQSYCCKHYPDWLEAHQTDAPALSNKPDGIPKETPEEQKATLDALEELMKKFNSGRK